jgi:catechol 2,3-dioxygenase-like lactoylglutathione lyase family enzyme
MTPKLDLVGLIVEDLERSLAFYRRLGLDVSSDGEGHGHVETTLPGGLRVAWDTVETVRSFDPDWQPPSGGQQIGLAFLVDSPAEVDSLYTELSEAGQGGHKEPWDAFWGQRYAQVEDPDGNVVDLFAWLNR